MQEMSLVALQQRAEEKPYHHFEPEESSPVLAAAAVAEGVVALTPAEEWVEVQWGAATAGDLLVALREAVGRVGLGELRLQVSFVPPALEPELLQAGFGTIGEYQDFWLHDLEAQSPTPMHPERIRRMTPADAGEVAAITQACRFQSRGFRGETAEWVREWLGDRHRTGFLAVEAGQPVGALLTAIYGFDSPRGPICWIREVAVRPEFQGRGIGRDLILAGLQWGKAQGARRSFLHSDVQNPAVRLYRQLGYEGNPGRGQIDLGTRALVQGGEVRFVPWDGQ